MHTARTRFHPLTPAAWLPLISPDSDPAAHIACSENHRPELDELRAEVDAALSEATEPPGLRELRNAVEGVLAAVLEPPRDQAHRAPRTALESCLAGIVGEEWQRLAPSSGLL